MDVFLFANAASRSGWSVSGTVCAAVHSVIRHGDGGARWIREA